MSQLRLLPLLWLLLLAVFFFIAKRKNNFTFFRQVLWQLLLLLLLSGAIFFLETPLVRRIFFHPRLFYFLWLFVLLVFLVLVIRILTFFLFDFFFFRKQGIPYPKLFKDIVIFVLYIIGAFLILRYYLNINQISILAPSAIVTVIVGLAVQDILGNLFSGIVLNFDESFKLGNWISVGSFEGRIEQLGWRSIKVLTVDNQLVVIPNQAASKQDVVIYGGPQQKPFALRTRIGVDYRSSPDLVIAAIGRILQSLDLIRHDPAPTVLAVDFAESAVTYEIRYWLTDLSARTRINGEIRRRLWYEFNRSGIRIPFPVRDVYLRQEADAGLQADEVAAALRGNELLRVIDEAAFASLLQGVDHVLYGAGEFIIREGETSSFFYHILQGEVEVRKGETRLALLRPGDFFGEISLVTGEPPNATVVARCECVLIRISSVQFRAAVNMNPGLAQKLSDVIARRQEENRLLAEKSQGTDLDKTIKKNSASIFRRIIIYFGIKD